MQPKSSILILSGWAQNPQSLNPVFDQNSSFEIINIDYSLFSNIDDFFCSLENLKINPDIIVGWSLGGQIACQLIARQIFSPKKLILFSTPFQFVKNSNIAAAMPVESFNQFYDNFTKNSAATLEKFSLLMMMGDPKRAKELADNLYVKKENYQNLIFWLEQLKSFSCHELDFNNFPKTLIFHGKGDVVVNYLQSEVFAKKIKNSQLEILTNCGHCPHISNLPELRKLINNFND